MTIGSGELRAQPPKVRNPPIAIVSATVTPTRAKVSMQRGMRATVIDGAANDMVQPATRAAS